MISILFAAAFAFPAHAQLIERFQNYDVDRCFKEGTAFGPWTVLFTGFGCAKVEARGDQRWLRVDTAKSRKRRETHAVFVAGPAFASPLSFQARVRTVRQLRVGRPNPWEVGWLVWDYRDNGHFYYFVPRTNGWELGKRDPVYGSGQRTLASGPSPRFPLGVWTTFRVVQDSDNGLGVYIDGKQFAYYKDEERPYRDGRIGFYDEDSRACIGDVSIFGRKPAAASGENR